ncbi:MAG: MarR family winged helix-turn-helix transcriptional regulator [Carbonactinosporaceae bacterium]
MEPEEPFDDPRLTAMGLLVEAYEGITAALSQVHAAHGLSGTDFDVLIRLGRSPGRRLRMADLAAQTALSTSGITRIVDRLEHAGLVARAACAGDRRSFLAVLTDAGADRLAADIPPLLETIDACFTGQLPPERLEAFLAGLRTLRAAVRPAAAAGADVTPRSLQPPDGQHAAGRQRPPGRAPARPRGRV